MQNANSISVHASRNPKPDAAMTRSTSKVKSATARRSMPMSNRAPNTIRRRITVVRSSAPACVATTLAVVRRFQVYPNPYVATTSSKAKKIAMARHSMPTLNHVTSIRRNTLAANSNVRVIASTI